MEKSSGFLRHSETKHQTNNLFLRFIANKLSSPISHFFLTKSLIRYFKYEDEFDNDENFKMPRKDYLFHAVYAKLYYLTDKPYSKWGTTYTINMEEWKIELDKDELLKKLGSDYDENGVAYWEKW